MSIDRSIKLNNPLDIKGIIFPNRMIGVILNCPRNSKVYVGKVNMKRRIVKVAHSRLSNVRVFVINHHIEPLVSVCQDR